MDLLQNNPGAQKVVAISEQCFKLGPCGSLFYSLYFCRFEFFHNKELKGRKERRKAGREKKREGRQKMIGGRQTFSDQIGLLEIYKSNLEHRSANLFLFRAKK